MADTFYPFVENGQSPEAQDPPTLAVSQPARIAVFDNAAAAPRVVVIEPSDIRSFLEEITATVTKLAKDQGGSIPFTVIREVVENLIHAYFIEPTVSILDGGNTIRFSDQGPGIADKDRALEYGTTSATADMKRYIRGVGSGLPYAQQWLQDNGGSLTVEDNIHNGTVVTISLVSGPSDAQQPPMSTNQQLDGYAGMPMQQMAPMGSMPVSQPYPQQGAYPQAAPGWPAQGTGMAYPQQSPYPPYPQPYAQQPYAQPWQQMPTQPYQQAYQQPYPQQQPAQMQAPGPQISERGMFALEYLRTHDSVGPRDLNAIQQLSESTWSRELAHLETLGLISKQGGQKRRLTPAGRQMLGI